MAALSVKCHMPSTSERLAIGTNIPPASVGMIALVGSKITEPVTFAVTNRFTVPELLVSMSEQYSVLPATSDCKFMLLMIYFILERLSILFRYLDTHILSSLFQEYV